MKGALLLAAVASLAAADDVLYSKRLSKRLEDHDGHANICKFSAPSSP